MNQKYKQSAQAEILQIIKRPRNRTKKIFIVEGTSDQELFQNLLISYTGKLLILPAKRQHHHAKYIGSHYNNKGIVINVIQYCNRNFSHYSIYGIVDADFMYISGRIKKINNLIYTSFHDIDIEIFTSEDVLYDFLQDAYPERNLDVSKIKKICLEIAKKFGEYIYLLEIKKIYSSNRKRKHFVIDHFLSNTHSDLQLNIEMVEDHIKTHWNINIGEIKRSISRIKLKKYDPKMFANGHDYFRVLWKIKETELYELGPFPVESNYLNLAYFKCEKILKVNYSKPEIFNINFWNKICEAL